MPLLLRTPRDFDETIRSKPGTCFACGEWLVRYVPYCTVCLTPFEKRIGNERALNPKDKNAKIIRLAHLSDLHVGRPLFSPKPLDTLRIWVGEIAEAGADLIVISGDIVERSRNRRAFLSVRRVLEESGLPFIVVPGNHDVGRPGKSGSFEKVFGEFPRIESVCGLTFILLDSNAGLPTHERRRHERLFAKVGCFVEGRVGPEQLSRVDHLLSEKKEEEPRILVLHHHLVSQPGRYVRFGFMAPLQDAHSVRRWSSSRNVILVLHGHHHQMRKAGVQGGGLIVLNGGSSTLMGPPFRARLIDIHPDGKRRIIPVELRL